VGQRRKPQPCLAVTVACLAPRSFMTFIHWSVSSFTGLYVLGSFVRPAAYDAFLAQLSGLQPGSPFRAKVATGPKTGGTN
jgi:hypothetical protein